MFYLTDSHTKWKSLLVLWYFTQWLSWIRTNPSNNKSAHNNTNKLTDWGGRRPATPVLCLLVFLLYQDMDIIHVYFPSPNWRQRCLRTCFFVLSCQRVRSCPRPSGSCVGSCGRIACKQNHQPTHPPPPRPPARGQSLSPLGSCAVTTCSAIFPRPSLNQQENSWLRINAVLLWRMRRPSNSVVMENVSAYLVLKMCCYPKQSYCNLFWQILQLQYNSLFVGMIIWSWKRYWNPHDGTFFWICTKQTWFVTPGEKNVEARACLQHL